MTEDHERQESRPYWFVGASYGGADDQTAKFLSEGIWRNGWQNRYLEVVKSMQPGDGIAIKYSATRKHNLPFDAGGRTVSVMGIKAIGTVTENLEDGRNVRVDWTAVTPPREWYFYTSGPSGESCAERGPLPGRPMPSSISPFMTGPRTMRGSWPIGIPKIPLPRRTRRGPNTSP